mgnify:CR=1
LAEVHKRHVRDGSGMDPAQRHRAFHRLNFCPLRFRYIQPPVGEGKATSEDLLLVAHRGLLAPSSSVHAEML